MKCRLAASRNGLLAFKSTRLPERHADAKGNEARERTVKVIDMILVANVQSEGGVFCQPPIHASPDVEAILGRGSITVIEAVAPHNKGLDISVVLPAKKVVGGIKRRHSQAYSSELQVGSGVTSFHTCAQPFVDKHLSTKTSVYTASSIKLLVGQDWGNKHIPLPLALLFCILCRCYCRRMSSKTAAAMSLFTFHLQTKLS